MGTIDKIGRVSSASVQKHTKKGWDEWVRLLEAAGARTLKHGELTAFLKKRYRLSLWWCEAVAIGFEMHAGLRVEGRNSKGLYAVTVTKTYPLSAKALWAVLASPRGLKTWLEASPPFKLEPGQVYERADGIFGQVRTRRAPTRVRMSWQEPEWSRPSIFELSVIARPKSRCIAVIQHGGLPSNELREKMRAHWKRALLQLEELVSDT